MPELVSRVFQNAHTAAPIDVTDSDKVDALAVTAKNVRNGELIQVQFFATAITFNSTGEQFGPSRFLYEADSPVLGSDIGEVVNNKLFLRIDQKTNMPFSHTSYFHVTAGGTTDVEFTPKFSGDLAPGGYEGHVWSILHVATIVGRFGA